MATWPNDFPAMFPPLGVADMLEASLLVDHYEPNTMGLQDSKTFTNLSRKGRVSNRLSSLPTIFNISSATLALQSYLARRRKPTPAAAPSIAPDAIPQATTVSIVNLKKFHPQAKHPSISRQP